MGHYPCSHHRAGETEARGGWRTVRGGVGVSSEARGPLGRSARWAVLPPRNPQRSRVGGHAAWFLAGTFLSEPWHLEASEGQACAGELGSELPPVWWRISFRGFRSSRCSRLQKQKSLSVPMWKVPCGLVPAPSFASAETCIT